MFDFKFIIITNIRIEKFDVAFLRLKFRSISIKQTNKQEKKKNSFCFLNVFYVNTCVNIVVDYVGTYIHTLVRFSVI